MQSYRNWKHEKNVEILMAEVVHHYIENISPNAKSMERLGMLLGKERNRWYELIPGMSSLLGTGSATNWAGMATKGAQAREGEQTLARINQIVQNASSGSTQELTQLLTSMRDNSPLKQAVTEYGRLKSQLHTGAASPQEISLLLQVLLNCTKSSEVPFKDLKELWHAVTGISGNENDTDPKQTQIRQLAIQNDMHTPMHLLRQFFKFGQNGVFTQPGNIKEINNESGRVLYAYFPDRFQQLMAASNAAQGGSMPSRRNQQTPAQAPPAPPTTPATAATTTTAAPAQTPQPVNMQQILNSLSQMNAAQRQQLITALQSPAPPTTQAQVPTQKPPTAPNPSVTAGS